MIDLDEQRRFTLYHRLRHAKIPVFLAKVVVEARWLWTLFRGFCNSAFYGYPNVERWERGEMGKTKQKVTAVVATGEWDQGNCKFSELALRQLAEQAPGTAIKAKFWSGEELGSVTHASLDDGKVEVIAELLDILGAGDWYIVPGFQERGATKTPDGIVFDAVGDLAFSLTQDPSDLHLTPVRFVDGEEENQGSDASPS